MGTTLKDMREKSGLTLSQVVEEMQKISTDLPRTHVGLKHIENRGTDRYPVIAALAKIYDPPFSVVAAVAMGKDLSELAQFA